MARILIADDDDEFRAGLAETVADAGHIAIQVDTGPLALRAFERERIDAAILDLRMPGLSGLEILAAVNERRLSPGAPIIVLTGFADAANTIETMRLRAFDHLTKPVGRDELLASIDAALAASSSSASQRDTTALDATASADGVRADALVGASEAMRDVQKKIGLAARADAPVLVTGETGTGKEVVARLLHRHSERASGPFVAMNCAAIPAELIESELFGHVKGAFSGAIADRAGSFQQAEGGILFLDEIGDMPMAMQAKLLRVLQDHVYTPVGGARSRRANVRIVAATHHDLAQAVVDKRFRADLRFRLDVLRIQLPALRERTSDIVPIAQHFLRLSGCDKPLAREVVQRLEGHAWPGNVRELRNVMERAAVSTRSDVIMLADIEPLSSATEERSSNASPLEAWSGLSLPDAVERLERLMIEDALARAKGNRTEAARLLGIRRQLLYAKLLALKMELQ